jgi:excisionase family DNA binding protein
MNPVPTPTEQPTIRVEEAGRYLGLGRSASYNAARAGDIPTIRVGRRLLVPTAPFRAMLGLDAVGGAA